MEQVLYKKKYTVREFYSIFYNGLRKLKYLRKSKKKQYLNENFIKRIMLGVTEVNGCEVCSYAHTKSALEIGMDEQEIQQILSGFTEDIPNEELKAILFAQHYADTKGIPTKEAWQQIIDSYGYEKALGILGAIRMIMVGNSYGIALSAFKSRMKGKPIRQSSLLYELTMLFSLIPFLPAAIIQVLILNLLNRPIITC